MGPICSLMRATHGGEGAGEAKLKQMKSYRLTPGQAGVYDVRAPTIKSASSS